MRALLLLHVAAMLLRPLLPASGPPYAYALLLPLALALAVARVGRRRALLLFAATYAVTWIAEMWGTHVGLFGARYAYVAEAWRPLPPSLVIGVVPCMWFMMMYPSYLLARMIVRSPIAVALVGAGIMTAWDLVLDPASVAAGLWRWSGGSAHIRGVPIENYLSWLGGSALVIALYTKLEARWRAPASNDLSPLVAYLAVAPRTAGTRSR